MTVKKIIVTGGHVTPALAVIDVLKEKAPKIEIVFVGRKYNNQEHTESFEYQEVRERRIRFIHLTTGRSVKEVSISAFSKLFSIPLGMWRAWKIISQEKPDLVLSFGGYIAMPVTAAASIRGIPVFTHEQTIYPGLANRSIARRAQKVFVAFPEAGQELRNSGIIVSGNPVRPSIYHVEKPIKHAESLPCIYVTGGSLGAHAVNICIEKILPELLKSAYVIHQTGNVKEYGDFERLSNLKRTLHPELQARYDIRTHVTDAEIGAVFAVADIIVGRSGANTFFEAVSLRKPIVCIPLPEAAFDEQRRHARILQESGVGEIFEQDEDSSQLLALIHKVLENKSTYEESYTKLSERYKTEGAAEIIAQEIIDYKAS